MIESSGLVKRFTAFFIQNRGGFVANEQNLKKFGTDREPREAGKKGGIASGKARRKKRAMKDATKLLLNMAVSQESIAAQMEAMGISEEDLTNQMAMLISMWKEAMSGNVRAAEFLRDTAGQNPQTIQSKKEFEYKKERDAGISQEIEDLDDIEEEIYGKAKERQESKEERSEAEENDNV